MPPPFSTIKFTYFFLNLIWFAWCYSHTWNVPYIKRFFRIIISRTSQMLLGLLASMRHLKNEVDSIKKDVECGVRLEDGTITFQPGDILVCYQTRKEEQQTDWDPGFWKVLMLWWNSHFVMSKPQITIFFKTIFRHINV